MLPLRNDDNDNVENEASNDDITRSKHVFTHTAVAAALQDFFYACNAFGIGAKTDTYSLDTAACLRAGMCVRYSAGMGLIAPRDT